MEFGSLAARFEERRGEKREEEVGLYRRGIEGHLLARNQREVTPAAVSIDREGGRGIRGEDGADMRSPHVSVGGGDRLGYRFGFLPGLRAASSYWAEGFPGSNSIFISSFPFFFFGFLN
jgi:hypothetical protein